MKKIWIAIYVLGASLLFANTTENWPKEITTPSGIIKVYQPEVETFSDNSIESRSTIVLEYKKEKPVFGAVWFESSVSTDFDERKVTLIDAEITASKFPEMNEVDIERINRFIEDDISTWNLEYSLDELLATVSIEQNKMDAGINNTPPTILFATVPTALILINGDPIFENLENTNFKHIVNTPFMILQDQNSNQFYLKGGKYWYTSPDLYLGWHFAKQIPADLLKIQKNLSTEEDTTSQLISNFIVRTDPTELLSSNGDPEFAPIKNTGLLYMANTDNDVILNIETQEYFTLLSGRWYKTSGLFSEKWSFVSPDSLPADFYNIGENTPVSNVRANISGTKEAKIAVLETQIPQTATIDRRSVNLQVTYDGKPTFKRVKDTDILYALNTDKDVLLINGIFYACDNGVWYQSKEATGPWAVSTSRPDVVDEIPPEYPIHRVKYVYVFDYDPDYVTVGYYSGYLHNYVYRGTVLYGTGYYYRPWYRSYYYPQPLTYGYGAYYTSSSGWSFSYGLSYGGYGWIHDDVFYRNYYRGLWGPRGYRYHYTRPSNIDKRRGYYRNEKRPMRVDYRDVAKAPRYKSASARSNNLYLRNNAGVRRTGNTYIEPKTGNRVRVNERNLRPRFENERVRNTPRQKDLQLKNSVQHREQWKDATPRRQIDRNTERDQRSNLNRDFNKDQRDERPKNAGKVNLFESKDTKRPESRTDNNNERRTEKRSDNRSNSDDNKRDERRIDRRGR